MIKYFILKFLKPKYAVVKGVQIYDRAVFTLIKIGCNNSIVVENKLKKDQFFYIDDIYSFVFTFKNLVKWGRLLAPSRTRPLSWTVLIKDKIGWRTIVDDDNNIKKGCFNDV